MYQVDEFDKQKTKVMKYIVYKKRTKYEVKTKFSQVIESQMLEDIIEYLEQAGYLSDKEYIRKSCKWIYGSKEFIYKRN